MKYAYINPDIVKAFANKEMDLAYIGLPPSIIGSPPKVSKLRSGRPPLLLQRLAQAGARIVSCLTGIVDEDFVREAYNCAALSLDFVDSTMAFLPVLRRLKYISRDLSEGEIFERAFIDKVHREPPHYNGGLI